MDFLLTLFICYQWNGEENETYVFSLVCVHSVLQVKSSAAHQTFFLFV